MAKKSVQKIDYRKIKKFLNEYHDFSFKMPRKGKDFTPQQKSAITRKFNAVGKNITAVRSDKGTFIKYPKGSKLPHIEGRRTNKGIFYKVAGAKVATIKEGGKKKTVIKVKFGKRNDLFIPFPPHVVNDPLQMNEYISKLEKKYRPKSIHLSVYGWRSKERYYPNAINYYQTRLIQSQLEQGKTAPKFDGVWLIF